MSRQWAVITPLVIAVTLLITTVGTSLAPPVHLDSIRMSATMPVIWCGPGTPVVDAPCRESTWLGPTDAEWVAAEAKVAADIEVWITETARAEWFAGVARAEWFAGVARAEAARRVTRRVESSPSGEECGGVNSYAAYIYSRESGCNPNARNTGGCVGLGQACPGSKLPCAPDDFACQHEWFSNYAESRYGSWEEAYQFWRRHRWW